MKLALLALLAAAAVAAAAAAGGPQLTEEEKVNPWKASGSLKCDMYVSFQIDASNSMHVEQLKAMRKEVKAAVAGLPVEGKLWYQFSSFAKTAHAVDTEPQLYDPAQPEAFDAAVERAVPAAYVKKPGYEGNTNHGAAIHLGSQQVEAARKDARLEGVAEFLVLVVTDGETTWWTDRGSKAARKSTPKSGHEGLHLIPCYRDECEISTSAAAVKASGAKLGVLFVGEPRFAQLMQKIADNPSMDARKREAAEMNAKDYQKRRTFLLGLASESLGRDLRSWDGLSGTLRDIVRGGCGEAEDECQSMYITVLSDISRSTIVGENPTAHVKGVWDALAARFDPQKVYVRIFAFASKTYNIIGDFVPIGMAQQRYEKFELGLIEGRGCEGRGVRVDGADEAALKAEFQQHYDSHADLCVGYFRHPDGTFHVLLDDTFPGTAIEHALAASETSLRTAPNKEKGAKSLWLIASDAAGYDNKNPKCHKAFGDLKKQHDAILAAKNLEGSDRDVKAHKELLLEHPQLEKDASECCQDDKRCNLVGGLNEIKHEPVLLLFAGTTFKSDTTIAKVRAFNARNGFDAATVFEGTSPSAYPSMLKNAFESSAYLNVCVDKGAHVFE